jgi:tetratricopeptide (TPR) repeat protein
MARLKRGGRSNTQPNKRKPTSNLPVRKKLLFSMIAVFALFAILELACALVGVRPARFVSDPYIGFSSSFPLFVKDTDQQGKAVYRTGPEKEKYFNQQRFAAAKPRDGYRIFCVGGSTTQGFPYDDATSFPGWLRRFLAAADSTRRWEVVNCGGKSYASYRVAKLMEELIQYEPDLFIVYSAHNEFLERRTYSDIIDRSPALTWLEVQLMRSRLYSAGKLLADRLSSAGPRGAADKQLLPGEAKAMLSNAAGLELYERDDAMRGRIYNHYAFNLARMIQIAHSVGAEIMFVQPARNQLDFLPFKSQFREDTTPSNRQKWHGHFLEGIVAAAKQDYTKAIAEFNAAIGIDDRYAEVHYELGRALAEAARYDQARDALERAIEEDICPVRAPRKIEQILREVATDGNVDVIPFADLLEQRSERELHHRLLGAEFFVDHVHTTIPIHRLLAEAIVDSLVQRGIVTPAPDWDESKVEAIAALVNSQIDEQAHAAARRNLAITLAHAGNLARADRLNRHAVWLQSKKEFDLAEARYRESLDLLRAQLGDDSPFVTAAMGNVARLLFAAGKLQEAEPVYLDVLRRQLAQLDERHPEVATTRKHLAALRQAQLKEQASGNK